MSSRYSSSSGAAVGPFRIGCVLRWPRAGESRTVTIRAVMTATSASWAGWRSLPELRRLAPCANGIGTLNSDASPCRDWSARRRDYAQSPRPADHLPLWSLVAVQAFRLPLELAMHGVYLAVAVLSTPRFHYFGNEQVNVRIRYPPFVWLPAVMVLTALAAPCLDLPSALDLPSGSRTDSGLMQYEPSRHARRIRGYLPVVWRVGRLLREGRR